MITELCLKGADATNVEPGAVITRR
jgi:hypothetical protein